MKHQGMGRTHQGMGRTDEEKNINDKQADMKKMLRIECSGPLKQKILIDHNCPLNTMKSQLFSGIRFAPSFQMTV